MLPITKPTGFFKISIEFGGIHEIQSKHKKTEEGYSIWVPGLPCCWSQGQTEEESLENIRDAIQDYLKTVDGLISS